MIIAVDFDGILCTEQYPRIGKPIADNIELVRELYTQGHRLILWTCRTSDYLDSAKQFLRHHKIYDCFEAFNENLADQILKYGNDSRKIGADYYWDDKNTSKSWLEVLMVQE